MTMPRKVKAARKTTRSKRYVRLMIFSPRVTSILILFIINCRDTTSSTCPSLQSRPRTFTTSCWSVGAGTSSRDLRSGRFLCFCREKIWATHPRPDIEKKSSASVERVITATSRSTSKNPDPCPN